MLKISLKELVDAVDGVLIRGKDRYITSISIDSRETKNGDFFIPIIGEKFDGHNFISSAFESGAIGTLTERNIEFNDNNKIIVKVKNTTLALKDIAKLILMKKNIPVIAVTGSTGKTTTKELIYNVLSTKYNVLKNEGNYNNHIGLPLTLFNLNEEHEVIVLEMGMSGRGEIDSLAELAHPQIAVITNIGFSHIEKLGSQDEIFKAKMEISNYMKDNNILILNGDDKYLQSVRNLETSYKKIFVGYYEKNDLIVTKNYNDSEVIRFEVLYKNKPYHFKLSVPGEHNIYNSLLAISVGIQMNIPMEDIQKGISTYKGSNMRLSIVRGINNSKIINDCYNASPDSMLSALKVLSKGNAKRRIAVLGDMYEMGNYSEAAHKRVGYMVKDNNIDILITVGKESLNIGKGAIEKGFLKSNQYHFTKNHDVIKFLQDMICSEDFILIKGSRGMKMEEIVQSLQERSN